MNDDVRRMARESGVPFWRICQEIGVSEATLTRVMRTPLSKENRKIITDAIVRIAEKGVY